MSKDTVALIFCLALTLVACGIVIEFNGIFAYFDWHDKQNVNMIPASYLPPGEILILEFVGPVMMIVGLGLIMLVRNRIAEPIFKDKGA